MSCEDYANQSCSEHGMQTDLLNVRKRLVSSSAQDHIGAEW